MSLMDIFPILLQKQESEGIPNKNKQTNEQQKNAERNVQLVQCWYRLGMILKETNIKNVCQAFFNKDLSSKFKKNKTKQDQTWRRNL